RHDYDPIAHARERTKVGDFTGAMGALDLIPEERLPNEGDQARICFEKQLCVSSMPVSHDEDLRLYQLHEGQTWFYETIARDPAFFPAYVLQSELWRRSGDGA